MSYYTEVNPPSVYAPECPCANDRQAACPEHAWELEWLAAGETALDADTQLTADVSLIVDYELAQEAMWRS